MQDRAWSSARLGIRPLLFSLYVNDLPNASNLETTLFADDTNLHISHNNIKNLQSVVTNEIKKLTHG